MSTRRVSIPRQLSLLLVKARSIVDVLAWCVFLPGTRCRVGGQCWRFSRLCVGNVGNFPGRGLEVGDNVGYVSDRGGSAQGSDGDFFSRVGNIG